jgi:hypothetical protein
VAAVALQPEDPELGRPRVRLSAAAEFAELVHMLEHELEQLVTRGSSGDPRRSLGVAWRSLCDPCHAQESNRPKAAAESR